MAVTLCMGGPSVPLDYYVSLIKLLISIIDKSICDFIIAERMDS